MSPNSFDRIRAELSRQPDMQNGTMQREPDWKRDVEDRLLAVSPNEPLLRWLEKGRKAL